MRSTIIAACAIALAVCALLFGDRPRGDPTYPVWEVKVALPTEIAPGRYAQVSASEVERLTSDGWQLVSVAPYVILNEERGPEGHKVAFTQTYPAYYFQRLKPPR